jgi:hypothetical protein
VYSTVVSPIISIAWWWPMCSNKEWMYILNDILKYLKILLVY